jgi:N-acetylglucosaminyl-diphospho-decaprenol L-rhamnosyltransferase
LESTLRWRIVIVNYRTGEQAFAAAQSARSAFQSTDHVTVVDSASGDNSCERLRSLKDVDLLALEQNHGFAAALNAGVGTGDSQWDVLLGMNADVLLPPEIRQAFERRLETLERLGVLAPRLLSPDGTPQPSCRNFPTHRNLLASRTGFGRRNRSSVTRPYVLPEPPAFTLCDVVAGACFAVRRATWEQLGGMDEQFFLYAEDTDFCRRAKNAGWLVGYEPAVAIRHEWRASTSQDRKQSARLHVQSLTKYFAKHFPERPWANRSLLWLMRAYTAFTPEE